MDVCHISFIVFYHSFFIGLVIVRLCLHSQYQDAYAGLFPLLVEWIMQAEKGPASQKERRKVFFSQLQPIEYCP
jgi:hypothetical protein